jgi:hypothetical protein
MKNEKYNTVETVPKSRKTKNTILSKQFQNLEKQKIPYCRNSSKIKYKIVERDTAYTQRLSWLATGTSIKNNGDVKSVLWVLLKLTSY